MKALRDVFGDTLVSLGWTNPNVVVSGRGSGQFDQGG